MNKPSYSLTAQLGALFAVVAVIVFSAVGFYLYQALAVQLQERDEADLVERMLQIRHLLEETTDTASIQREPHRFLDAVDVSHGLLLIIQTPSGHILTQNTAERAFTLTGEGIAADLAPSKAATRHVAAVDGSPLQVLNAVGHVGAGGEVVHVSLARTAHERLEVLRAYRIKVWFAAIAGAMLTSALGYVLVRRGLARVRALAEQAQEVTAHHLDRRLNADSAPAELRVLADSFNVVLDRLQNSFNNLSQFADDLAHDLRTPLNNLMVQTEVAFSQPRDTEEYQNLLSSNYEEFGRLARMVESMLFLARADHDQIALSTERLGAAEELGMVAEYFEGLASDAGIGFRIEAECEVWADAQLLRRAVSNLVANAVRYTPPGHDIILSAATVANGTTMCVTNPGTGIDPVHLPRLFDRFYRSDQSRSSQSSSAGLGLAIVKSIMALHGGHASVASEPDGETCFSLFFPNRS